MSMPLGPSGALKVAMELIDAQAAHIAALEAGRWGQTTRDRVREKRDELEIVTAAEDLPPAAECHQHFPPEVCATRDDGDCPCGARSEECPHGFHPGSCGMCTSPAEAYGWTPNGTIDGGVMLPNTRKGDFIDPATGEPHKPDHICNRACRDAQAAAKDAGIGRSPATYAGGEVPGGMIGYNCQQQPIARDPRTGNITLAGNYLLAWQRLQDAAAAAPEHENLRHHTEDAWAPKGICRRCDLLQPLQVAEQEAHARLIRHNHGIPPEGENRP
jgi:hypothetical protein